VDFLLLELLLLLLLLLLELLSFFFRVQAHRMWRCSGRRGW
jgi:hypothetical protein